MKAKEASRSRESESRRLETRIEELRDVFSAAYSDPLYIDQSIIPHGWEYYWGRESSYGLPDTARIIELRKRGWTPVPADRHPDLVFQDFMGRDGYMRGYISQKGLVLVERPKFIGDKARAILDAHNNKIKHSMPATEDFRSQPGITTKYIKNPEVTHEVGIEQGW